MCVSSLGALAGTENCLVEGFSQIIDTMYKKLMKYSAQGKIAFHLLSMHPVRCIKQVGLVSASSSQANGLAAPANPTDPLAPYTVVTCDNGQSFKAQYVICTVPLVSLGALIIIPRASCA